MRSEPDPTTDPYRTLGLAPGASMAEVKRAYRLLAKAFHPDSAGEAALPRFLAIHEAYEHIRTGRVVIAGRVARPAPAAPAEPWRADPDRARAARERARTARNGSGGATGSKGRPGARNGASAEAGATASAASAGSAGSAPPSGARGSTGTRGSGGRRNTRKATMGSTSYDDARDPNDASWSGASWYGPTTGEYWIINPREYADPRKHGPEYQSRARRPAGGDGAGDTPAIDETPRAAWPTDGPTAGGPGPAPRATPGATGRPGATDRPGATRQRRGSNRTAGGHASARSAPAADAASRAESSATASTAPEAPSRRWAPPSGSTWEAPAGGTAARPAPNPGRPGETAPDELRVEAFGAASRAWLGRSTDDPVRRLGLALVAWPPIGLAAAALIDDVTGCSVFSAECGGVEPLLPWLAQAAILGLLLLLPPLTRVLAGGAVMVLLALVPITAFLIAVGGTGAPQAGFALATLLGIAWLVGVGWATLAFRRRQGARASP